MGTATPRHTSPPAHTKSQHPSPATTPRQCEYASADHHLPVSAWDGSRRGCKVRHLTDSTDPALAASLFFTLHALPPWTTRSSLGNRPGGARNGGEAVAGLAATRRVARSKERSSAGTDSRRTGAIPPSPKRSSGRAAPIRESNRCGSSVTVGCTRVRCGGRGRVAGESVIALIRSVNPCRAVWYGVCHAGH